MDALPIKEETGVEYSSIHDGVMHACGHDGHTAILLGTAKVLSKMKNLINGNVKFIFQPAEEGLGGARFMIKDGALNYVDEIYGLHLWNYQSFGTIGIQSGPIMAAADKSELIRMVHTSLLIEDRPSSFRFPSGSGAGLNNDLDSTPLEIGKGRIIFEGNTIALVNFGARLEACIEAIDLLKLKGYSPTLMDARFANPLDHILLNRLSWILALYF